MSLALTPPQSPTFVAIPTYRPWDIAALLHRNPLKPISTRVDSLPSDVVALIKSHDEDGIDKMLGDEISKAFAKQFSLYGEFTSKLSFNSGMPIIRVSLGRVDSLHTKPAT